MFWGDEESSQQDWLGSTIAFAMVTFANIEIQYCLANGKVMGLPACLPLTSRFSSNTVARGRSHVLFLVDA